MIRLLLLAAGVCGAACGRGPQAAGCDVNGPSTLMPSSVARVRLGMTQADVERALGKPTYSPIEGQYYFATGGDCPLEDTGQVAPCGVIADFRRKEDSGLTRALQWCTWGAIGE